MREDRVISKRSTKMAEKLHQGMAQKKLNIRELAEKSGVSYEYVRRVSRGIAIPSKHIIKALAPVLGFNQEEMEQLAVADRINSKYGKLPSFILKRNPELAPVEAMWDSLTDTQKEDVIIFIEAMTRKNRQLKRQAS